VTPAVMDELRQRRVKLKRIDPQLANTSNTTRSILIVAPKAKLSKPSTGSGLVELAELDDELHAIVEHVSQGGSESEKYGAIWCCPRPFAAALATRTQPQLRGVQLASFAALHQSILEVQPNVLVIDQRHWSHASVANLARAWKVQK